MKGIGKERIEVLRRAQKTGRILFSDMTKNVLPILIKKGLMHFRGFWKNGRYQLPMYALTEKGKEFLNELERIEKL